LLWHSTAAALAYARPPPRVHSALISAHAVPDHAALALEAQRRHLLAFAPGPVGREGGHRDTRRRPPPPSPPPSPPPPARPHHDRMQSFLLPLVAPPVKERDIETTHVSGRIRNTFGGLKRHLIIGASLSPSSSCGSQSAARFSNSRSFSLAVCAGSCSCCLSCASAAFFDAFTSVSASRVCESLNFPRVILLSGCLWHT
jgi:hypothetical protein